MLSQAAGIEGAWKQTYQAHLAELEEKKKRIGQKVRRMWEYERQKKESRQIQVCASPCSCFCALGNLHSHDLCDMLAGG